MDPLLAPLVESLVHELQETNNFGYKMIVEREY